MALKSVLLGALLTAATSAAYPLAALAQASAPPPGPFASPVDDSTAAAATLDPGTRITTANWQQYRNFMSDGVQALFEGKYFWKMPANVEVLVGRTHINPPPKTFLDATEKYAGQVKLVDLPDSGLTLSHYQGGYPFPGPSEPHKGWKILANLWYRYFPNSTVIIHGGGCTLDQSGSTNCTSGDIVYRQLGFNTDPGVPATLPGGEGKFFTQWYMLTEPEQKRYTASLQITYADLQRNEDLYAFIPQLRRYQPVSTLGRCSMVEGVDITQEDYRSGFDSNLTELKVDFLGERKIIALILPKIPDGHALDAFLMPLGWPKPSWGEWQVRDVYVISVSKLPARMQGYCYGKRIMYVDKATYAPYWEELYDMKMQPWKIVALYPRTAEIPGIGKVDTSGSLIYSFWDIQRSHASFVMDPTNSSYPFYAGDQVPEEYRDVPKYSTPGGLSMIMR